jgi:hypothetical protein
LNEEEGGKHRRKERERENKRMEEKEEREERRRSFLPLYLRYFEMFSPTIHYFKKRILSSFKKYNLHKIINDKIIN